MSRSRTRAQELYAVDTGHRYVGNDGVELFAVDQVEGGMAVRRRVDGVAGRFEDATEGIQQKRFVVGDQYVPQDFSALGRRLSS